MQNNIIKIELLNTSVVLFHFKDGTKATVIGDTIKGTAKEITYTGGKTYDAAMFLKNIKADQSQNTFWWEVMDIVDEFKTLVYEG
jgi:hypothetical protein